MASVLFFHPWQWLWFLGGHLDFLYCDPGGGTFLGWSGLPPQHFGHQCPILSHLEQWESHVRQFALPAGCCLVQLGQSLGGADGVWSWLLWLVRTICPLSWQIVSIGLVLWETCSLACWMAKWFTAMSARSLELSLSAVCMDNTVMQLVHAMLIIDHLAVVHQCLDAYNEILGVLSWPGYNLFKFSKMHMSVDIMCHSLLDSVEEGRSFCIGCFLFLFTAGGHPLCMHFQGFGSQGCKDIPEVVLAV